jgi:hypothetical protein
MVWWFSRFELEQKRKEYKHKKGSACIDTKKNRIKFKRHYGHGQRCWADFIDNESWSSALPLAAASSLIEEETFKFR